MGRPRKAPSRITTFNLPLTVAEQIDSLRLPNRSEWATRVFSDHFKRRSETDQAKADLDAIKTDPAALIAEIPTARLAAALLARVPPKETDSTTGEPISNTRLRNLLVAFINNRNDRQPLSED